MNVPPDLPIEEMLIGLGIELPADRAVLLTALVEARITNGKKIRISRAKEPAVREILEQQFVPVCDSATCLVVVIRRHPDRRPYRSAQPLCASCGLAAQADPLMGAEPVADEGGDPIRLGVRAAELISERPRRLRELVRRLGELGVTTDKRSLRHLAELAPRAFLVRPGEVIELGVPAEQVPLLLAAAITAERAISEPPEPFDEPLELPDETTDSDLAVESETDEISAGSPPESAESVDQEPAANLISAPLPLPLSGLRIEDLRAEEDRRVGSFSAAMAAIESELRLRAGGFGTGGEGLFGLLDAAADVDPLVRSHRRELGRLIRLRNAVAHESRDGRPVAIPSASIIADAWRVSRSLSVRSRAVDLLPRVISVAPGDGVAALLTALLANGIRGVPVHDGNDLFGVISADLVLAWVSASLNDNAGRPLLHGNIHTAADLLAFEPDLPIPAVVQSSSGPGEVAALLSERSGPGLVLITPNGSGAELPIALAAPCDLPTLLAAAIDA